MVAESELWSLIHVSIFDTWYTKVHYLNRLLLRLLCSEIHVWNSLCCWPQWSVVINVWFVYSFETCTGMGVAGFPWG